MTERYSLHLVLLSAVYFYGVWSHGNMLKPYSWIDGTSHIGMTSMRQCDPGYDIPKEDLGGFGGACMWFSNYTFISGNPTLPKNMRTYKDWYIYDWTAKHPWRAPGSAPIFSPCGAAGGNPKGCEGGDEKGKCPGGGYPHGPSAEDYYKHLKNVPVTEWSIGATVEVAWAITANHGGGYSYRLCKVPESGVSDITEECFQKTPLKASSEYQWVQFGKDGPRFQFVANRTTIGTYPKGSEWTKNPIPACNSPDGGVFQNETLTCKDGTQFPPPLPGIEGYGISLQGGKKRFPYSIVDQLQVPLSLIPGDYVLSFRWDCEQTSQVWNTCANIRVVKSILGN